MRILQYCALFAIVRPPSLSMSIEHDVCPHACVIPARPTYEQHSSMHASARAQTKESSGEYAGARTRARRRPIPAPSRRMKIHRDLCAHSHSALTLRTHTHPCVSMTHHRHSIECMHTEHRINLTHTGTNTECGGGTTTTTQRSLGSLRAQRVCVRPRASHAFGSVRSLGRRRRVRFPAALRRRASVTKLNRIQCGI